MKIFSHTTHRERLKLYSLARFLPANARALEIGSHIGSSANLICAGLAHGGGRLYCVDTWMNETMPDGVHDTYAAFSANTARYAPMITKVRKSSQELERADVEGDVLDLIFIDGDHSEDAVRADFTIVSPWTRVGSLMAFHDIRPSYPGVNIVVGEAMATGDWRLVDIVDSMAVLLRIL